MKFKELDENLRKFCLFFFSTYDIEEVGQAMTFGEVRRGSGIGERFYQVKGC